MKCPEDKDEKSEIPNEGVKHAIGRVTGQMQAAMPSYMIQGLQPSGTGTNTASFNSPTAPNAKQYEVLKRARQDTIETRRASYRENADPHFLTFGPKTRREFFDNLKARGGSLV